MVDFKPNIIILGCGAIGHCFLDMLLRYSSISAEHIIIIDNMNKRDSLKNALAQGVRFYQNEINRTNFASLLNRYINQGDICIDLANEVDTYDLLTWCQEHRVRFLNTNLNIWKDHTLLIDIYTKMKSFIALTQPHSISAILSHGANPGLVSSFMKKALIDMMYYLHQKNHLAHDIRFYESLIIQNSFGQLAYQLGIKTVHIAEKDSQIIVGAKKKNVFLNTWSIVEFINECTTYAHFAWGTHEKIMPSETRVNQGVIFFQKETQNLHARSWIPEQEIQGIIPVHDETFTIADYLTLYDQHQKMVYRPTVNFVYAPCAVAMESLKESKQNNPMIRHVIKEEIVSGADAMGILLLGNPHTSWWTGSLLTIEQSRELLPGHNATIMQVASGVLAAFNALIQWPESGIRFPEQLHHQEILNTAMPFLGNFISQPTAWNNDKKYQFIDFEIA